MTIFQAKRWNYLLTPAVFFIISMIWAQLSISTWDDDAATRFFGTLRAADNPQNFLDSWYRPLFVDVFYFPIYFFGRTGLVVTMSLFTALSGILLYKGLRAKGVSNAYAAMFFFFSQTFLFGITRDAMTEPLASFVLSIGCYFYLTEKWGWFAVAGSFLPLARTETVLLLPVWAFVLFQRKKYNEILLLGVGLLLLFLAWAIYSGNFHAFFDNNIRGTSTPNRYARTDWDHYFGKLAYVIGPVTFIFLLLGYVMNLKKIFVDLFFMLQFTLGFVMYMIFGSAEISLGQAAGFLRHLVTFAPLIAVISLYGFNYWATLFTISGNAEVAKQDKKKIKSKKSSTGAEMKSTLNRKIGIGAFLFMLLLISFKMFSQKLLYRQFYSEDEKDYTLIYFIVAAVFCLFLSFSFKAGRIPVVIIAGLFILQTSFTLYYEQPDSHSNGEREALTGAADWIIQCKLSQRPIYCNNYWFYWSMMGRRSIDLPRKDIDSTSLKAMSAGSLVVWEPHYTNKYYSNIPLGMLTGDTSFVMVNYLLDKENSLRCLVFTKQTERFGSKTLFEELVKADTANPYVFLMKGIYEKTKLNDLDASTLSMTRAIALKSDLGDAYFQRGENYLMQNNRLSGCSDLQTAKTLGNQDAAQLVTRFCASAN